MRRERKETTSAALFDDTGKRYGQNFRFRIATGNGVSSLWATTQMNLGTALFLLGERESGTAHLTEAVSVWEASLTVTASAWPQAWVQEVHALIDQARTDIARRLAR